MSAVTEVQVGEHFYHLGKVEVRTQLQLVWRFGTRIAMYVDMRKTENNLAHFLPLFMTLSMLPQEASDYIVETCLGAVQRKDGQGWAKLLASNGTIMYSDLGVEEIHTLVDKVLEHNLGSFFGTLRQNTSGPAAKDQTLSGSDTNRV